MQFPRLVVLSAALWSTAIVSAIARVPDEPGTPTGRMRSLISAATAPQPWQAIYFGADISFDGQIHAVGFHCNGVLVTARLVLSRNRCLPSEANSAALGQAEVGPESGRVISRIVEIGPRDGIGPTTAFLLDAPAAAQAASVPSYRARDRLLKNQASPQWFYRRINTPGGRQVVKLGMDEPRHGDASVVAYFDAASSGRHYSLENEPTFVTDGEGVDWFMGTRVEDETILLDPEGWPQVYQDLLKEGARAEALALAKKLLNPYERSAEQWGTDKERRNAAKFPESLDWGAFDRRGVVGSIYPYANPYTKTLEFFRLVALGSDEKYWYFPTDQKDNEYWEYLGLELPTEAEALSPVKTWHADEAGAAVGDVYVHVNAQTREAEYFRLEQLNPEGRYGPLPTNRTNDGHWTYLGTNLPAASAP